MSCDRIVSFQEERKRIELENCQYEGTVKIYIEGKSFENAKYFYSLEYIEKEYLEEFLLIILNTLIEELVKTNDNLKIQEPIESLLNREYTIDYYSSIYSKDHYFFEQSPKEITYEQLIVVLNSCVANLRQI